MNTLSADPSARAYPALGVRGFVLGSSLRHSNEPLLVAWEQEHGLRHATGVTANLYVEPQVSYDARYCDEITTSGAV